MAAREVRASPRRLLLLTASVAVGVAALVAINSFTDNLRDSVRRQAQGAARRRPLPRRAGSRCRAVAEALLDTLVRRGANGSAGHQLLRDGATSRAPTAPAWCRWRRSRAATRSTARSGPIPRPPGRALQTRPPCGGGPGAARRAQRPRRGHARAGRGAVRHHRHRRERARQRGLPRRVRAAGLHPRARTCRRPDCSASARGRSTRPSCGCRASVAAQAIARALPAVAARRAGPGAHRRGRPARTQRALVAAHRLSRPGRPDRAAARRDRRGERGGRLHPPAAGHHRGAPLPRRHRRAACSASTGPRPRAMGLAGSLLGAAAGVLVQQALARAALGSAAGGRRDRRSRGSAIALGIGMGLWVALGVRALPAARGPAGAAPRGAPAGLTRPTRCRAIPGGGCVALALAASTVALAALQVGSWRQGAVFAGGVAVALLVLWAASWALVRAARRWLPGGWPYLWRQGLANLHRPSNQTVTVVLAIGFGAFLLGTLILVQLQPAATSCGSPAGRPGPTWSCSTSSPISSPRWSDRSARRASRRRTRCRSCRCASRR